MDRLVAARKLVADLVKDEQIEVRRGEIVGRDLAQWCDSRGGAPSGEELEGWLGKHSQVLELYATPSKLEELLDRYLRPPPVQVFVDADHPELEAQLHAGPDVPEPYMVYADWLQEQSDPRGELIALGVAATTGAPEGAARFEKYLKQHDERLFGTLTRQLWDRIELTWKYGLVHTITEVNSGSSTTPRASTELWDQLLRLRVCKLLQSIRCSMLDSSLEEAIHAAAPATLKHLDLTVGTRLPALLLSRPLRSLSLYSGARVAIGPVTLPASLDKLDLRVRDLVPIDDRITLDLRELHLWTTPALVRSVHFRMPKLERLQIDLGGEEHDVATLLERLGTSAVTHLTIENGQLGVANVERLAALPLASRLVSLALPQVELGDAQLDALVQARASFPALRELDLTANEISLEGFERANVLAATVIGKRQAPPGSALERRNRYLNISRVGEVNETGWQQVGRDGEIVWARYRGSSEYELFVAPSDRGRFGCTCPSRYQPCKHVNALWQRAREPEIEELSSNGIEERIR